MVGRWVDSQNAIKTEVGYEVFSFFFLDEAKDGVWYLKCLRNLIAADLVGTHLVFGLFVSLFGWSLRPYVFLY